MTRMRLIIMDKTE